MCTFSNNNVWESSTFGFLVQLPVSTVDEITALRIATCIDDAGGTYMEAPVSGSKGPAEAGQLIFLGAGNKKLYESVQHPLEVMGKASFYLGAVGAGSSMKLVVNQVGFILMVLPCDFVLSVALRFTCPNAIIMNCLSCALLMAV
eukprot:scaffold61732_cov25-Prasinocladus_malaysianus.AAC.1